MRGEFQGDFARFVVPGLARARIEEITLSTPPQWGSKYLNGVSTAFDDGAPDYAAHAERNVELRSAIEREVQAADVRCPRGAPLTPEAVLRRASAMSCAGCHAPESVLGRERDIGCGLSWPASLGISHVDERGELSPALREVFLPYRAERLTSYVKALTGR